MDVTPPLDERCAGHPERASVATCVRCGTFMCGECSAEAMAEHCAGCASRLEQGSLVAQVPIFAIVMIVHGVLLAGAGIYFLVFGVLFAHNVAAAPGEPAGPDALMSSVMLGASGVIGVVDLLPGALQIWAGVRLRSFRSRTLGLVALGAGVMTVLGCYCAPTSIALLIWGAIVLTHDDVRSRFAATRPSGT